MRARTGLIVTLVWTMSACHSVPQKQPSPPAPAPATENSAAPSEAAQPPGSNNAPPPGAEDLPKTEPAEIPPCLPLDNTAKPAPQHKPKPVARVQPPSPTPPPAPPQAAAEAGVKLIPSPSASILGKKVRGGQGDDLGRLVDILADPQGRVRIAIIEFGGFLGVGNRRIAVDWSLLKFHPEDPDAPVVLDVAKRKLQGTPEYKGSEHPLALMAPEAAATPRPTTPN